MVDQNFEGEVYYLEFEDENGNKQYFTEDVVLNHEVVSMQFLYMYKTKRQTTKVKMTHTWSWLASKKMKKA